MLNEAQERRKEMTTTINDIQTMTFNALRSLAASEGLKLGSHPSRQDLMNALTIHLTPVEPVQASVAIEAKRARGRPSFVDETRFVEIVNGSENLDEACASLASVVSSKRDLREYICARSHYLRSKGVLVKEFKRGRKPSRQVVEQAVARA